MMLYNREYHSGKRNPEILKSTLSQLHGRRASAFNAAIFARSCEQAEAKGNNKWWNAEMMK